MILVDLWEFFATVPATFYAALGLMVWAIRYGTPRKPEKLDKHLLRTLQNRRKT